MRVLCIDAAPRAHSIKHNGFEIEEGKVYIVIDESYGEFPDGRPGPVLRYELQGLENKLYDKDRFVPLSDIDETQMNRYKEKICSSGFIVHGNNMEQYAVNKFCKL